MNPQRQVGGLALLLEINVPDETAEEFQHRPLQKRSFIPASNEPNSRVCTDIWRMPRGAGYQCGKAHPACGAANLTPLLAAGYLTSEIRKKRRKYYAGVV